MCIFLKHAACICSTWMTSCVHFEKSTSWSFRTGIFLLWDMLNKNFQLISNIGKSTRIFLCYLFILWTSVPNWFNLMRKRGIPRPIWGLDLHLVEWACSELGYSVVFAIWQYWTTYWT